ncbi:site-specific integrase [Methylobacterium soli]|uniref:Tyrosine-type recombinase/integrase n=1 Tax=Methylobacterium soli TaxID=553447 RepID=A0A6L3T2E7_9HYPH|nr:site-specific integrase [Methylobacterium soli]KAB1080902.1 tyrosine-type recombinase/integrase [Methylobacterium soli]GJE44625.1 Tyrosine recombinase XerC [Methylobacterium soli]
MTDLSPTKLTKRRVDAAHPAATRYIVWDSDLKGYGLRIEPSGLKSYLVRYRAGQGGRAAPKRFLSIGRHGALTADEARRKAKEVLGAVARGEDPAADRAQLRAALTVADIAQAFLAEHMKTKRKPSTLGNYRRAFNLHILPSLGRKLGEEVTRADVARLHHKMQSRPSMANYANAALSSMYAWAAIRRLVPVGFNPAAKIEKYRENQRERFLSVEELERLGLAIRTAETLGVPWEPSAARNVRHAPRPENRRVKISPHAAAALRLLLFTGARLREILHLRWEHVDLARGLLLLPDSKTGKKTIVLNAPALQVLANTPRVGAFVIAGASAGQSDEKPRSDLKRPWELITKEAGLEGVRLHDLRHSFASVGAGGGLGLPIIGKLLGHSQAATTQRYAHLDADPLRRAANEIGARIAHAMGDTAQSAT